MPTPTIRTPYNEKYIIEGLAEGKTISQIAKELDISIRFICTWRLENTAFDDACVRSMHIGIENQVDRLRGITDEIEDIGKARLISENIKWEASKRKPQVYGDRINIDVTNKIDLSNILSAAEQRAQLISPRYPENTIDAEIIDTKQLSFNQDTDTKPVDPKNTIEINDSSSDEGSPVFDPYGILE